MEIWEAARLRLRLVLPPYTSLHPGVQIHLVSSLGLCERGEKGLLKQV